MIFSARLPAACPAVLGLPGGLHLPAYAVIAIAGILAALWLSLRTAPLRSLSPDALWDAGFFAVIAAFVLSRVLGFLLLFVLEHGRLSLSLVEILRFSSISYLSLLVTAAVVALWLRHKRLPLLRAADAWSPCAALLWSALALADASSGAGSGLPTRMRWGLRTAAGTRVHPVAFYTAAVALALCAALFALLHRLRTPGRVTAIALAAAGTLAFLLDMFRLPENPFSHALLDTSQVLALAAVLAGVALFTFIPGAPQPEVR